MSNYIGQKCDKCGAKNQGENPTSWVRVFGAFSGMPIVDARQLPPNTPLPTGHVKPVALDFCPKCQTDLKLTDIVGLTSAQNPTRPASPSATSAPATDPAPTQAAQ